MQQIWQALENTPWWVYVLLIYLIKVGIDASKPRVVSLKKIFIIPIIFVYLSIHTLITAFNVSMLTVTTWIVSLLIGISLGWIQIHRSAIKVDKEKKLLQMPGTWTTLIVILIIFAAKYYFSYELAADPTLSHDTGFEIVALLVSGVCTGLFIGRLLCYLYRFRIEDSVSLTE